MWACVAFRPDHSHRQRGALRVQAKVLLEGKYRWKGTHFLTPGRSTAHSDTLLAQRWIINVRRRWSPKTGQSPSSSFRRGGLGNERNVLFKFQSFFWHQSTAYT